MVDIRIISIVNYYYCYNYLNTVMMISILVLIIFKKNDDEVDGDDGNND